ncbi:MAG: CsgG/HfaB family protein [Spirochaetia bacterium]|nr:CsgG/HfaB family protein [Spirochaetia bacterium]
MKIFIIRTIVFVSFALCMYNENYAETRNKNKENQQVAETGKLVNRRVLILDFVNTSNASEYAYLETTIPDTFLSPLNQTKSFELMSRSIWHEMINTHKASAKDAFNEKTALASGKTYGADVVVIGNFTITTDAAVINTQVVDISSGKIIISKMKTAKIDGNIFTAISELAQELGNELKEKLPPLPQQLIVKERVKYLKEYERQKENPKAKPLAEETNVEWSHKKILLSFSQGFDIDVLNLQKYGLGMQGSVGFNVAFYTENQVYFGVALDFAEIFSGATVIGRVPVLDTFASVGYSLLVHRWLYTVDVGAGYFLMPISTGITYNPFLNSNIGAQYLVLKNFSIGFNLNARVFYDQPSPLFFSGISLVLGYVL